MHSLVLSIQSCDKIVQAGAQMGLNIVTVFLSFCPEKVLGYSSPMWGSWPARDEATQRTGPEVKEQACQNPTRSH